MKDIQIWDNIQEQDINDIFDFVCEIFSQKLPEEMVRDYNINEIASDIVHKLQLEKKFEKMLHFVEIIKTKQLDIYEMEYPFINGHLIDYFCHQNNKQRLNDVFSEYIADPVYEYKVFLAVFSKLLFYQHTDLLLKASETRDEVAEAPALIPGAEVDFDAFILAMKFFEYKEKYPIFDRKHFVDYMHACDYVVKTPVINAIERVLYNKKSDQETLRVIFKRSKEDANAILKMGFYEYMTKKGINYYLSEFFWRKMLIYWEHNFNTRGVTIDKYHRIEYDSFESYLAKVSGAPFCLIYSHSMFATLWGSVFVADYLKEMGVIGAKAYDDYITVTRKMKGILISGKTKLLWKYSFIHTWGKPDGISNDEFAAEKKLFDKSFLTVANNFDIIKEEIADELNEIGELADFIYEGNSILKAEAEQEGSEFEELLSISDENLIDKYNDLIAKIAEQEDLIDDDDDDYRELGAVEKPASNLPIKREKKIGRNEPCPCGSKKKFKKCCGK